MNTRASLCIAACAALALAGCATQSNRIATAQPQASNPFAVDGAYVTLVNQEARRRGVQVEWVNPPNKRARTSKSQRQPLERNDAASRAELY
jgi:ABC-type sugar transport system substrate-binding protein